jgi:hypothetical protein
VIEGGKIVTEDDLYSPDWDPFKDPKKVKKQTEEKENGEVQDALVFVHPLSEPPEDVQDVVIAPFIRNGDMSFIVGRPSSGKSTFLAELALGLVDYRDRCPVWRDGQLFRDAWRIVDRKSLVGEEDCVLVIDGENSRSVWRQLIARTLSSYNLPLPGDGESESTYTDWMLKRILHVKSDPLNMYKAKGRRAAMEVIVQMCEELSAKAVIMDYAWKIFSPHDNADTEWVNEGLSVLRDKLKERGILSFVVAHPAHAIKDAKDSRKRLPYGTAQQQAMADARFYIKRNEKSITLYKDKDRAVDWVDDGKSVLLDFGAYGGGYTKIDRLDDWPKVRPVDIFTLTEHQKKALLSLPPMRDWTLNSLTERERGGYSENYFKNTLRPELKTIGLVEIVGKQGKYEIYRLSQRGIIARKGLAGR